MFSSLDKLKSDWSQCYLSANNSTHAVTYVNTLTNVPEMRKTLKNENIFES